MLFRSQFAFAQTRTGEAFSPEKVLCLGAGAAEEAWSIWENFGATVEVIALDVDEPSLARVHTFIASRPTFRKLLADATRDIPVPDNSVDFVVMRHHQGSAAAGISAAMMTRAAGAAPWRLPFPIRVYGRGV